MISGPPKRDWSFISMEQLRVHAVEADRIVRFARDERISYFGAALAGAGFVREALGKMGGKPEWWMQLITAKDVVAFLRGATMTWPTGVPTPTQGGSGAGGSA